jgi:hypothetical protein
MLKRSLLLLLLHVSWAVWFPDLINRRLSPSNSGLTTFKRRYTVKNYRLRHHPFDFISRNIDFSFRRKHALPDYQEISEPVVEPVVEPVAQRFVTKLCTASRINDHDSVDRILSNDVELLKSSQQWANLSSRQFQSLTLYLDFGSFHMRSLLLKILKLDIPTKTSTEKLFLLELCSIIIQAQRWSFTRTVDSDFLFKLLKGYGDLIVDYIPESVWLSLNLTQAEKLLDLGIESVSSHVKNYKSIFVEGMDETKSRKLQILPWERDINFIYKPEFYFFGNLKYVGQVSLPMKIQLGKSLGSDRLQLTFSFDTKPRIVPEFLIYIETKDGSKRMATKLFFLNEEYKNTIIDYVLNRGKEIKFVSFLDASPFLQSQEYAIVIQIIRLVPISELFSQGLESNSKNSPKSTAVQDKVLPFTSRPKDFSRSQSQFKKPSFSRLDEINSHLSYMHLSGTSMIY